MTYADIRVKRRRVVNAYATQGFHSAVYEKEFAELHTMNMAYMAHRYRAEWGLPPNSKTPYCP